MISKPSGSEFVTIMTSESFEIISEAAFKLPKVLKIPAETTLIFELSL